MIKKYANSSIISPEDILSGESLLADSAINERFKKFASDLKKVAPKANDFIYFSAVMMHAAEASAINSDGTPKLTKNGEPVKVGWDTSGGTWKWITNDPAIKMYKNQNGDIFPESELLKAHRKWIEKPLCVDHKSSSVDAIRGVILDTYYDHVHKRVIALCALDKVNYPDLARKVSTGYSTSVSMGTAVGRAICTEDKCHKVAKTEQDFCDHMRRKTSYGEINVDLQPIELSIVVNGADPQAKIKHIIASANILRNSLAEREAELDNISEDFSGNDKLSKIHSLENELKEAHLKLDELKDEIKNEDEEVSPPYGQTSGTFGEMDEELSPTNLSLNLPQRFAKELISLRNAIESIDNNLISLSNKLINKKEEIMSVSTKNAYFQGAGGVNEPTPGKPKYEKDPLNEENRLHHDKQMNGEPPFPEVGDVEGLHPSPSSVQEHNELERKKMLARAELDVRTQKRVEALQNARETILKNKSAYFQGGGGVNEPTPHKVKYDIDKLNYEDRVKFDKQMNGQKPFPGVGDVEGLHPSPLSADEKDELSRKKKLLRASFVRAANADGSDNLGASAWQVFADDKLVLTASVDAITKGNSEALFDTVATKVFASQLLKKVREQGVAKVASLYSRGQALQPTMPSPAAEAPVEVAPVEANEGDQNGADMSDDKSDMKETALQLAEEVEEKSKSLTKAVKSLAGEQSEMASTDELAAGVDQGNVSTASLQVMRKQLNRALISGMKNSIAELQDHGEELHLISDLASSPNSDIETVKDLTNDAFADAKNALADANDILKSFFAYAEGAETLKKVAAEERLFKSAQDLNFADMSMDTDDWSSSDDEDMHNAEDMSMDDDCGMMDDDGSLDELKNMHLEDSNHDDDNMLMSDDEDMHDDNDSDMSMDDDSDMMDDDHLMVEDHDTNDADTVKVQVPGKPGEVEVPMGSQVKASAYNLSTKEGRFAYRNQLKLAADVEFSEMLDKAHDLADGQTELDTKPSDSLGLVETVNEQHEKDLEVAKAPPSVRKEAKRIQNLIASGELTPSELDQLVANGADPAAVKYWKDFYGQEGSEGKEFATDLVKEYAKAQLADELAKHKVKVSRAYDLAHEMARKGLINNDRLEVNAQVEKIMEWNDQAFDNMKKIVAKQPNLSIVKEASARVPQVGQFNGQSDSASNASVELEFAAELDRAFSNRKY